VGAIKNLLYWHESESALTSVFLDWQSYIDFSQDMMLAFSVLIAWVPLIQSLFTVLMFLGGLLVLIGVKEKLGISLLIAFLSLTSVLYHPFWWIEGASREMQTLLFFKDLSLMGCLIHLLCLKPSPSFESSMMDDPSFSDTFSP
jgi:uncharacterized membrane protein YphA (DoxX/SURF4 family)